MKRAVGLMALLSILMLTITGTRSASAETTIIDLGTLGGDVSLAAAISASGQVVGWSETEDDEKHAILVKKPEAFKLPSMGLHSNFLIAKEDYFFLYPTKYHKYKRQFQGSFQHGGISLEEMILPVVVMRSK